MSDIKEMLDNIIDARRKYQVNNRAYFWHRKYEMACMYDAHISTCKSLEAERDYAACHTPSNYPVPALLGPCIILDYCVIINHAVEDNTISEDGQQWMLDPVITWWKHTPGLDMPEDHGIAEYRGASYRHD